MSNRLPVPPGWYPDPAGSGRRWWDGTQWGQPAPAESAPPPPPPPGVPPPPPPRRSGGRAWIAGALGAAVALAAVVAFSTRGDDDGLPGDSGGGRDAPEALDGTFVCQSSSIAVVRMPGPFTIGPLDPPKAEDTPIRLALRPDGTYTDITFTTRPLEGEYEIDDGVVTLDQSNGNYWMTLDWARDTQGTEYLVERTDAGSRQICRRAADA